MFYRNVCLVWFRAMVEANLWVHSPVSTGAMAPVAIGAMVSGGYNNRKSNTLPESGWKHKNLLEMASDGRTEETGFS